MVLLLHYSSGPVLAFGILQNDINHGATIHSVLHVRPYNGSFKINDSKGEYAIYDDAVYSSINLLSHPDIK